VKGGWRDKKIAELEAEVGRYKALLSERDRKIEQLMAQVQELTASVKKLEEQARTSSRNSSKPPSSDGPAAPPRPKKLPTGRKPGGQPGHERHERELLPVEKVSKVVACIPEHCERCDNRLRGKDPQPKRHQVAELPQAEAFVTEYQQHGVCCDKCGHCTFGKLPNGVPTRAFGPNVDATVALLMGVYRLGKRLVPELMQDLFGLRMSLGAVIDCQQAASDAMAVPVEQATTFAQQQPVKHADETSWREGPQRARVWLWTVVTSCVTVFCIHARRNANAARELLGQACGVLITDRHGAYMWWPDQYHQFCWAHIKRDVTKISERGGDSERIGLAMLQEISRMFTWWHRVRDGTLARSTFQVYMRGLRRRFEALLAQGVALPESKTSKTCKKLLKHAESLWTFVYIEGVEPTNNRAEQAVRHGVILRKISGGTNSEAGSRFIERILTVHATLRQQQRPILEFLCTACQAALLGKPAPSLLPVPARTQHIRTAA
jgi:transposase